MNKIKILLLSLSPLVVGFIAIFVGVYKVSVLDCIKIFLSTLGFNLKINSIEKAIIINIRLPRIILAGVVGASLSGSGVVLQAIFRNPLVDPFILGISSGAAFGCAIALSFFSFLPISLMAFVFGIIAVILAYFTAKSQGEINKLSLVLSGVIVSAFFSALVSIVKFLVDPHKLQSIIYWLMGSFSLADWGTVKAAIPGIALGLFPLILMRWRLNVISMGEEEAKALGVNIERERALFIAFSTLAVASATSICGIIGWVGLMVPHLVRMLIGPDHKILLPLSLSAGATFMIMADTLSRTITNFDIPVGIITALTGAPFFIYLMKKSGQTAWGK